MQALAAGADEHRGLKCISVYIKASGSADLANANLADLDLVIAEASAGTKRRAKAVGGVSRFW